MTSTKKIYPYSRNRVYGSAVIAALSMILGAMMFQTSPALILYYLLYSALSTTVFTVVTYFLKIRIYPLITEDSSSEESSTEDNLVTWKRLLFVFGMLIIPITVPMLLAGVLGGLVWFILMISFIMGVSFSEIIFYAKTR